MLTIFLQIPPASMLDVMIKQGPLFAVLALICYVLYKRQEASDKVNADRLEKVEARALLLTERLETYMKEDRTTLLTALQNNTDVMGEIKEHLNK